MRLLIEAGSNIEARTLRGNTPLHVACLNGQANSLTELISIGANIGTVIFSEQHRLHEFLNFSFIGEKDDFINFIRSTVNCIFIIYNKINK